MDSAESLDEVASLTSSTRDRSRDALYESLSNRMQRQFRARGKETPEFDAGADFTGEELVFHSRIRVSRGVKYFDKQVLNYDSRRLNSLGVLDAIFHTGSTFSSMCLWRDVIIVLLIAVATCLSSYFYNQWMVGDDDDLCTPDAQVAQLELLNVAAQRLSKHMLDLLPFLLGLYLTTSLDRWWAMRTQCLGELWAAMDDLALLCSVYFPRPEDKKIRERVLRWALLSHQLMHKQAMNNEDLSDLMDSGMLLPEEYDRLRGTAAKPQQVWVWVASFFSHLAYGGTRSKLPYREFTLPRAHRLCMQARGAIGSLFAYLDSQLPFRYVHLLSLMVWIYNLSQAVRSGTEAAISVTRCLWVSVLFELVIVVTLPCLFLGLLHLAEHLLNPFRTTSVVDFPRDAINYYMKEECEAFFKAGQNPPFGPPPLWEDDDDEKPDEEAAQAPAASTAGGHGGRRNKATTVGDSASTLSESEAFSSQQVAKSLKKPQRGGRVYPGNGGPQEKHYGSISGGNLQ